MAELRNSFIGIASGTAVTTGNSGGASGDAFTAVSGSVVCNTSADITRMYDRGAVVSVTAGTLSQVSWTLATPSTTVYVRRYFRAATPPGVTARLMRFTTADGNTLLGECRLTSTGQFLITGAAGQVVQQTATGVFAANTTYRLEVGLTAGVMTLRVYPGESVSAPVAVTSVNAYEGTAWGQVRFGIYFTSSQTWSCDMAAIGSSTSTWLGPAAPAAFSHVTVWNGTYESAVQSVTVWNGSAEVAATVEVQPAPPGSTDAGADTIGTASYTPPAGSIYVAPSGSDTTGTGAVGAPYATAAKAVAMAVDGSTIVLRAGSYHEGGDTSKLTQTDSARYGVIVNKSVTIQNYPGEAVWFDGSSVATGWVADGANWRKDYAAVFNRSPTTGWNALDGTTDGWQWVNASYPCAPWPEQVFIDGVQQEQVSSLGAVGPGKFYVAGTASGTNNFTFTSSAYYIGTDPAGKEVRIGDRGTAMLLLDTDITVKGIGFRRYCPSLPDFGVIRMNRARCALENVRIEDCAGTGVHMDTCTDGTLTKVTATNCSLMGAAGNRSDNVVLDRCKFTYNTSGRFNRAPVSGGVKWTKSLNFTMKGSIVSDNYRQGFWCDESVTGIKVLSSDVQRNGGNGIVVEISEAAIVVNNLVTDNTRSGIYVSGVNNSRVWCNTVHGNGSEASGLGNIFVYQDARRPETFPSGMDSRYDLAWHQLNCSWSITAFEMKNNISDEPATTGSIFRMHDPERTQGGWNGMGLVANGNLYCQKDANVAQAFLVPTKDTSVAIAWASFGPYATHVSPQEPQSAENRGGGACVLDAGFAITATGTALANPLGVPADIAALVGWTAGSLLLGAQR